MNSRSLIAGAGPTLLCVVLIAPAVAQDRSTLPDVSSMMQMAEPAPPRPGDAAMTCEQIAREFQSILKKKNVQPHKPDTKAACELRHAMAVTPAEQAAMSGPSAQAEAVRQQKAAQMQQATADMMEANRPMMEAMNDPRLMRLAILADEKHCAIEAEEPPAQAPAADPCGSGVGMATPAIPAVTGGVVPPAPATSARSDPFKPATKAPVTQPIVPPSAAMSSASPASAAGTNDPFVKQGTKAPPPAAKQPTADPFRKN